MKPYIILILIISVLWLYESSPICIRIGNRGYTDKRKQVMLLISVLLVGIVSGYEFFRVSKGTTQ